ncbi:UNVERIFIED_CONTAM: hypothetical protein FKN15_070381 [Acipenser sinensis]
MTTETGSDSESKQEQEQQEGSGQQQQQQQQPPPKEVQQFDTEQFPAAAAHSTPVKKEQASEGSILPPWSRVK